MTKKTTPRHADKGASLLIVLIIVTVVSTVMGVVLSQVGTGIRGTVALRDQASDNYSADAATQAVLNGLQNSRINCTDPANPTQVSLGTTSSPFYDPGSSVQGALNAVAQCAPDAINGTSVTTSTPPPVTSVTTVTPAPVTSTSTTLGDGDPTLPSYAILTTGSGSGDFGLDLSTSANNKTVCIENGSVASNKDINAQAETLAVRLSGTGSPADCTTGTGVSSSGSHLVVNAAGQCIGGSPAFTPTSCSPSAPAVTTPSAPTLPASAVSDNPSPTCQKSGTVTYAAFLPGRYTSATQLNGPCGASGTVFEWLAPGTYYFDFSASTPWMWPTTVVGGTPITSSGGSIAGLDPTKAATLPKLATAAAAPNACADPAGAGTVQGVELVFGGGSTVQAGSGSTSQLCASSPAGQPPVAIYGLSSSVSISRVGGGAVIVPAETMCSSAGCGSNTLIATDSSAQAQVYIKGYVYAPNAQVIMSLKNSTGQIFNWGIVVRNFRLSVNGSSPTQPFVQLPKPNTGVGVIVTTSTPPPFASTSVSSPAPTAITNYSIRYISVWICPVSTLSAAQPTCPTSPSAISLQARVKTNGATLQVLSWNRIH
ncbi:MAG: hypothetical protein QOE97_936 [Pseudonocardiales bacterium]|nr:hypothetical protein [Pseudonocardiales bacterium]